MNRELESNVLPLEVSPVLNTLKIELLQHFEKHISSIIIQGSIAMGAFDPLRSDIDYWVILNSPLSIRDIKTLEAIHQKIIVLFPKWGPKLEASYILEEMLVHSTPPIEKRLYFNEGYLRYESFGAEWIFEKKVVIERGILLWGTPLTEQISPVFKSEVSLAAQTLLNKEWKVKVLDPSFQWDDVYLTYGILTVCRIACSLETGGTPSKVEGAKYMMAALQGIGDVSVIQQALKWKIGDPFDFKEEALAFIEKIVKLYEDFRPCESSMHKNTTTI